MLEAQERLSETSDRSELMEILSKTVTRKDALESALSDAFSGNNLPRASEIVTELSYLERIVSQTKERM